MNALDLTVAGGTLALAAWFGWYTLVRPVLRLALQRGATPPAPVLEPAPATPTPVVAEHVGAQDDAATTAWLGAMHEAPLLCDQPARPEPGDEAWIPMRLAAQRQLDARRFALLARRLAPIIGHRWALLIIEAEAELAEWHRLTDAVFEATSELQLVPSLAGAR